jgi:hypothetical protein
MTPVRPPGPARLLVVIYAIFAVAATARSIVQLATRFDEAPVAYALSAVAAGVYVVATFALAAGERGRRLATYSIGFELAGVLIVGTLSVLVPDWFPRATVWSNFGLGYLLIPLALPIVGLWWLRRTASTGAAAQG